MPKPIVIFRHTSHTEWGHGVIVEESAAKVYLTFEDGSRRPFLNSPKYRDQLVATELPAAEAEAIITKLTKAAAKPSPKKASAKKAKKAKAAKEAKEAKEAAPAAEEQSDDEGEEQAVEE